MATYLLTWNPRRYPFEELSGYVREIERSGHSRFSWSCGNTRRIEPGDDVFLLRQGPTDPGLVGSGYVVRGSHKDRDWKDARRTTLYVDVVWEVLSNQSVVPRRALLSGPCGDIPWNVQKSGVRIRPTAVPALERLWANAVGLPADTFCESDAAPDRGLPEGSLRKILVNAYERNPRARRDCIEAHGARCAACDIDFSVTYGDIGRGFIEVHHIRRLSSIGRSYVIDPVKDLVPLCPNCHAMVHRKSPPYSVEKLREIVSARRRR